jgi:phage terminase small subunit
MDQEQTIEEVIESFTDVRQKYFSEYYVATLNGAEAARQAGYSIKGAKEQASLLLTYTNVAAYIAHLKAERSKKIGVSAEEILEQLNTFRKANINDYVEIVKSTYVNDKGKEVPCKKLEFKAFEDLTEEQKSCIESVKMGAHGIELKLHGKDWTIEKINKHIDFYEKDNKKTLDINKPFSILFSEDETND